MTTKIKKLSFILSGIILMLPLLSPLSAHAWTNSNLIDDAIFDNRSSMSAAQIDAFLNSYPSSCISTNNGFTASDPTGYNPTQGYLYGGPVTAGQAIYDAAQAYEMNPQVLLTKLQNEEGLVQGNGAYGCGTLALTSAVGYGCPDSGGSYSYTYTNGSDAGTLKTPLYYKNGSPVTSVSNTCVNSAAKAGFSEQVIHAAWLLKFSRMRSEGNTNWAIVKTNWDNSDDLSSCYGGPMTQGWYKRCPSDSSATYFDGYTVISGQSIHMDTGATAGLYWYTPHVQSFGSIYQGYFGDPTTPCQATGNISGAKSGPSIISYNYAGTDRLAYNQQNNTGSGCEELHVEGAMFQSWIAHVATAMKSHDPTGGALVASNSAIDHKEALNYIVYNGASGHVEVHRMSPDFKVFPGYYDVATDLTGTSPTDSMFVSGDFLRLGYDQLALILFSGGSGHVEVHLFDPTLRHAIGYYDIATDLTSITSTTGTFVAGDFLGRGYDQLAFVLYNGAGGHVEVHLFDPTLRHAIGYYDVGTDLTGVTGTTGTFIAGDFLGRGYSQLVYVIYRGTNNMVETHMFIPSLTKAIGFQDIVTNMAGFDPTQ